MGRLCLRAGDTAGAGKVYQKALQWSGELATIDVKKFDYQWDLGFVHYRLGLHALRAKDPGAATHFQNCRTVREKLAAQDKSNERRQMELMLVVAHCGDHTRAVKIATRLENTVKADAEFLVDLGRTYAQCAAAVPNAPDLQSRYTNEALRVLRAAVQLGYRDEVYLNTEVDLDPVRAAPDFARLVDDLGGSAR